MKMPASGGDPVSSTLRLAFSAGSRPVSELSNGLEASAKRVLLNRIEFEPAANYQSRVLNNLKSKYIVINTKNSINNNTKVVNGSVNGSVNKKQNGVVSLPVPKQTLFSADRVELGYRGNLSVGSGMLNMGNTCYLNSTLQALFHVPALVNWLLSETSHQKCEQNSAYQMHPDDITCSIIKTFKCSQQKTGNCMKPVCVYSKLKAICKHLNHGSQEDAHEFMRYLLESLEKSYLIRCQGSKLDSSSKETTPINQIFGGYIRTEVACLSCRAISTTFQHFQDLPLDIRKASTLDDALAGYFERERLPEGEDAYRCEKCNRKVPATKKFTIEKPPNVLCVQLKRFSMMNGKITKQVQLPQYLDLTRFISPSVQPRNPVKYRLVSMVTHMGQSANCGHYTAIALAANGLYYQFDDSCVRQIPLSTVLNMSAYLVLYEMERPFTPQSPRPFPSHTTTTNCLSQAVQQESIAKPVPVSVVAPVQSNREGTQPGTVPTLPAPPAQPALPALPAPPQPSLVPYDSDEEEPALPALVCSELHKLLTKPASDKWEVTEAREGSDRRRVAGTTEWSVEDVACEGRDSKQSNGLSEYTQDRVANCEKPDRLVDRSKEAVTMLLQSSHSGYGNSSVRSWNGTTSNMEKEVEEDRRMERKRRSEDDIYNENFDMGKVKKMKMNDSRERENPRYNVFQERANWRNNHHKYNYNRYNNNNNNGYKYPSKHQNRLNGYYWGYNKRNKFTNRGYRYYNNYNRY